MKYTIIIENEYAISKIKESCEQIYGKKANVELYLSNVIELLMCQDNDREYLNSML